MQRISLKLAVIVLLFNVSFVLAQNGYGEFNQELKSKGIKGDLRKARKSSEDANFTEAIQRYRLLLKQEPENVTYNKELGMTFFDSPYQKVMSIPYLEKAIKLGKVEEVGELYYPLGVAYRMRGDYEKAKEAFGFYLNQLKAYGTYLSKAEEESLTNEINREIDICNNASTFKSIPPLSFERDSVIYIPVISKLPSPVNSIYDEYSPVFTDHDSTIIFTARRKGSKGGKVNWDGKFYEDIWVSSLSGQGWSEPKSIGDHINTAGHEAVNSISKDGKKLYIYRAVKNGSILESEKLGRGKWSEPKKLSGNVNSKAWETSLGVTLYDSVVYFVSDRKEGYGGRDIYVSRKNSKGEWGDGVNIGPNVNTMYEEDAPFLSSDGRYLYFASTGHNTMGGFDLYRSEWKDNAWGQPENLGSPINTENHDIYLMLSADGNKGWLSSQRISNDTLNDMNIYEIAFECRTIASAVLRGIVTDKESGKGIRTKITLADAETGATTDSVLSSPDGIYSIQVKPEKAYVLAITPDNFQPDSTKIYIPRQCKSYDLFQMMAVSNVSENGRFTKQQIELHNAFFDIKKSSGSAGGKKAAEDYRKFIAENNNLNTIPGYSHEVLEKKLKEGDVISGTEETFVNILFDHDSYQIRADARITLDKVAAFMKKNPDADVELRGFADTTGSEKYNIRLSENRSDAARKYLLSKGISKKHLVTRGFGESEPLNDNSTEEYRQLNRRVEFKVYPKGIKE